MTDDIVFRVDTRNSVFVDVSQCADDYTESPDDRAWFEKLHPSIVKSYCPDENAAPRQNTTQGIRASTQKGKSAKSNEKVASKTSNARTAKRAANSRGKPANSSTSRPRGKAGRGSTVDKGSMNASKTKAGGEDDIMALLAKHNKQFKPKSRYVARIHSGRDVKRWEVRRRPDASHPPLG